ncbi:MAG: hypothetical protein M3070_18775 [Actinomycetota bacterium]|nr:hypothetical protein [Actinomycetota bacterium]
MTDPENSVFLASDDDGEVRDLVDRDLPIEADEADAVDQHFDLPPPDEDDYPV